MGNILNSNGKYVKKLANDFANLDFGIKFPILVTFLIIEMVTFESMRESTRIQAFEEQSDARMSMQEISMTKSVVTDKVFNGLSVLPKSSIVKLGDTINVNLHLETGEEKINAAEIVLDYPSDMLEFEDVITNSDNFDIKVKAENKGNYVSVIVGSTKPRSGSIGIATIQFKAVKKGEALVSFDPKSQVLSSMTNKNILQNVGDTVYVIQ